MKRLLPLVFLLLFSCHLSDKKLSNTSTESVINIPAEEEHGQEQATHNQFESKNLLTLKSNLKKTKVALFLPFSGKHKELGWSLANAAMMSLFDNDHEHAIELVLIDSKETPAEASEAFRQVVAQNIKIVIGPVFGNLAPVLEREAKRNKITVISLSNNQELIGKINEEGGIFVSGFLPEAQIDRIVEFAMEQNKANFAVLAPNNDYGRTISSLFSRIVRNRDGNIITSEFYEINGLNIDRSVERIMNSFALAEGAVVKKIKGKAKKDVKAISEIDRIFPEVIFVPDSGKMLSKIAASFKKLNVDERGFQIVGTSQWDDLSILNDSNLYGSWFPAPENERFRNFERIFSQNFSKSAPRIASISYDLTAAIIELVNQAGRGKSPLAKDFMNYQNLPTNGFDGIDGPFRFLPNGIVQRNFAVLQVGNGKLDTVDRSLSKFLKY